MRILYAIQGTGNGHLSRAQELIPILKKYAEVDVLLSGTQCSETTELEVRFRRKGLSIVSGKKGKISWYRTWKEMHFIQFFKDILNLPVREYDLVISDFEPLAAWSAKYYQVPCFELSHQCAVSNPNAPKPILFAPVSRLTLAYLIPSNHRVGFHFKEYSQNVKLPLIREIVRNSYVDDKGHYTVYLPAFDADFLGEKLSKIDDVKWQVFVKELPKKKYSGITFFKVDNHRFVKSMATSTGVFCGAGFETPAEALFLKKKLMVIPMKGQFEQECNALALKQMGVRTLSRLDEKGVQKIEKWVRTPEKVYVNYGDHVEDVVIELLEEFEHKYGNRTPLLSRI